MNQLRIPIENWELGKDHIRLECPENLSSKKIESIFFFERKMLPCSTQFAKRDKNGRSFTLGKKFIPKIGMMYLDTIGNAFRVKEVFTDKYGNPSHKGERINLLPGYAFDPIIRLIVNKEKQRVLFPQEGIGPSSIPVLLPDHPRYKPPGEYDKLGCVKSKDREYTKLTDQVKKEKELSKLEKEYLKENDLEELYKELNVIPDREDSTIPDTRSFWRIILDWLIHLFKRE